MAVAVVPLVLVVVGALMYALGGSPKVQEMGRIVFFVGLFWLVSGMATKQLHF